MKVWYKAALEGLQQRVVVHCQLPTIDAPRGILAEVKAAFMGQESMS